MTNGIDIINSNNIVIGGIESEASNTIAYNHGSGIVIIGGNNNNILSNSIFNNTMTGIDLGDDGFSHNDSLDADNGTNHLQNYPVIDFAQSIASSIGLNYFVHSDPTNSAYPIIAQFFATDGNGQGKIYIGSDIFTEEDYYNNIGIAEFENIYYLGASSTDSITATATDNEGNTSEFSYSTVVEVETSLEILNNKNPNTFSLSQNYPNPFNPSTRISYSISRSDFISLKVYDLLGREIQTLVNEFQQANSYSIDFNASGLASGVYFYRLYVGKDIIETKKMLLLQ